ncbi:MAG: flagellar export protein FliJ [Spirochaetales bacterium]|nr:MAG: flagellar export protein FliJ [Spirochaetales bacterium]
MRRFHFKLDKVLKVREFTKRAAEAELARKAGVVALLEHELEENAVLTLSAGRQRFRPGGAARDFLAAERYGVRLTQARERLMKALARAEFERDKARQTYVEASRASELIQKLRERGESAYYTIAKREETKVLDEVAAIAKTRALMGG